MTKSSEMYKNTHVEHNSEFIKSEKENTGLVLFSLFFVGRYSEFMKSEKENIGLVLFFLFVSCRTLRTKFQIHQVGEGKYRVSSFFFCFSSNEIPSSSSRRASAFFFFFLSSNIPSLSSRRRKI